jgi:hypothetical protein
VQSSPQKAAHPPSASGSSFSDPGEGPVNVLTFVKSVPQLDLPDDGREVCQSAVLASHNLSGGPSELQQGQRVAPFSPSANVCLPSFGCRGGIPSEQKDRKRQWT